MQLQKYDFVHYTTENRKSGQENTRFVTFDTFILKIGMVFTYYEDTGSAVEAQLVVVVVIVQG